MTQAFSPPERAHVVRDAKGKRPQFYETPGLDQAMSMILVLANELSVLHDRLDSVERVSKAKGVDLAAEIEALVLDQEALEARETWRQGFLERLYYLARKDAHEAAQADSDERYTSIIEDIATS
jgi:tRNA A37 N6-isopentenylltransferase MiaA